MLDSTLIPDTIQISLTQGYFAIVDKCDVDLSVFKWNVHALRPSMYARRDVFTSQNKKRQKTQLMHRVIMERIVGREIAEGEFIDHIDGNGLNNTRSNLRLATHGENMRNKRMYKNNKSGYKGVYWYARSAKWGAVIQVSRKSKFLGYFLDIEDAARAYNKAALEHHGEFARLNEILE